MRNPKKIKLYSKLFLLITAVLFIGLVSCGKDEDATDSGWKYVGDVVDEGGGLVSVYIDQKDMVIEGHIRKFWIRYYAEKSAVGSEGKYIRQLGFWEVNCNDRKLFVLGEEYYSVDGKLLGRNEERILEDYKEGSLGDKLASAACRYAGRN